MLTHSEHPLWHQPAAHDARFSRVAEEIGLGPEAVDAVIEQLPAGMLVIDRAGRVIYANEAAHGLHAEEIESVRWAITRAMLTEDAVEEQIEIRSSKEPPRWLSVRVMPI